MNDNHCFLRLGEYWVDLTLTQFDKKAPAIWFRRRPYTKPMPEGQVHRASKKARTYKKLRKMFRGWPVEQNPFKMPGIPDLTQKSI
jgi:aldehyde:ferredoxin oxidoreductase